MKIFLLSVLFAVVAVWGFYWARGFVRHDGKRGHEGRDILSFPPWRQMLRWFQRRGRR